MKCTVWTKEDYDKEMWERGRCPRCVWIGEISAMPNKDTKVVVRDGFGAEYIDNVYYNFIKDEVQINLDTCDSSYAYGPCLLDPGFESDANLANIKRSVCPSEASSSGQ